MDTNINYPEIVRNFFTEEYKYLRFDDYEDGEVITLLFAGFNYNLTWHISTKPSGLVKFIAYTAKNVPEAKKQELYRLINKLQYDFRFLRLYIDDDNDLVIDYDILLTGENAGAVNGCLKSMMEGFDLFLEMNYPNIMRCLWSEAEADKTSSSEA